MKRISDLLEGYPEDTILLTEDSPLSTDRIRQLTMERIGKKKYRLNILPKLAAAVVAISILAVTAAAAEYIWGVRDWFGSAFNSRAEQIQEANEKYDIYVEQIQGSLTEGQLTIIESSGQVRNQAVTCDGSTITLTAVCSDEYVMHLYFQVEAPEGTVLPDGLEYNVEMTPQGIIREVGASRETEFKRPMILWGKRSFMIPNYVFCYPQPDHDPTDNKKDFMVTIVNRATGSDAGLKLNDGVVKSLKIYGLFVREETSGKESYRNIVPGEFRFDITNERPSKWIDVDVEGISYWDERFEVGESTQKVVVKSLRIGALSARWETLGTALNFDVYMKDGTLATSMICGGSYGIRSSDEDNLHPNQGFKMFHVPIDVDQIDYVLINEETKIYVNQEDQRVRNLTPEAVSREQMEILESIGQVRNETIESNGASITLQALCSDEYIMHLYFEVVAPEGVVLPDDMLYTFRDPAVGTMYKSQRNNLTSKKSLGQTEMNLQPLPDEDPTDNKKSFQLEIYSSSANPNSAKFNDGIKKTLNINGLYGALDPKVPTTKPLVYEPLLEGDFNFDITNEVPSRRIDVDVKGLTYVYNMPTGMEDGSWIYEKVDAVADSLRIGALTAEWVGTDPAYLSVYMKDGTKAVSGGLWGNTRDGKNHGVHYFYIPIDVDEIDYVLLGRTHKIYVNP